MVYARRAFAASFPRGEFTHIAPVTDGEDTWSHNGTIDWIAVERAANGDYEPTLLNQDELRETVICLAKAGVSIKAISTRLCTYERRIAEWLLPEGLIPPERICTHDDCQRLKVGKGLCMSHLDQMRRRQKQTRQAAKQLETAA